MLVHTSPSDEVNNLLPADFAIPYVVQTLGHGLQPSLPELDPIRHDVTVADQLGYLLQELYEVRPILGMAVIFCLWAQ